MSKRDLIGKRYVKADGMLKETYGRLSLDDPEWNWVPVEKVPISKIKIDRSYFRVDNIVNLAEVIEIIENFYPLAWEPIHINEDYYLLDGQHRLAVANRVGLKYIDVIMKKRKSREESNKVKQKLAFERKMKRMEEALMRKHGLSHMQQSLRRRN